MRKTVLEQRIAEKKAKLKPIEIASLDDFCALLLGGPMLPTQRAFIYDPDPMKAYMGHAGAAKTSAGCLAMWLRLLFHPGSKGLVARCNYNDLLGTTVIRMQEMLDRLPEGTLLSRDKSAPMRWWIRPIDPEGDPSMITFMGLTDGLGSYEFNYAFIDEADEVEEKRLLEVDSRCRLRTGGPKLVACAFNPPDKTHWLYPACTGLDAEEKPTKAAYLKLYRPKPQENKANLKDGYYEEMAEKYPTDMLARLRDGTWGSNFAGQPVYREFSYNIHVKEDLEYNRHAPLFRFWDFGYRRPACIWAQFDDRGRLLILREEIGFCIEAAPWVRKCKGITAVEFDGTNEVYDYGDPAATQKKDTGSTLTVLNQEGIILGFQRSLIEEGLRQVRKILESLISGQPSIQFHRKCRVVIEGMRGGYHLDDMGVKPVKDGFYDHLQDALRYGIINLFGRTGLLRSSGSSDASSSSNIPANISYVGD